MGLNELWTSASHVALNLSRLDVLLAVQLSGVGLPRFFFAVALSIVSDLTGHACVCVSESRSGYLPPPAVAQPNPTNQVETKNVSR